MIAALIQKDLTLYFRNQFFALVTGLGLVAYLAVYFLMPASVEEELSFGLYVEAPEASSIDERMGEYLVAERFESEEALVAALEENEYPAGMALTAEQAAAMERGESVSVRTYYAPGIPGDVRSAYDDVLTVLMNVVRSPAGNQFGAIEEESEVLGPDLSGQPIAARDRLLPTLILAILVTETMGLATLITEEVEKGTVQALLTSPLRLSQFFTAKTIMGVSLAFVQVLLIVLVTGAITSAPLMLLTTLLLGSLLVTGLAFIIAAISNDFTSVMGYSVIFLLVLVIPAITVVFPAIATAWVELIPTFYLVDPLHRILNYGANWSDVGTNLLTLTIISLAFLGLGSLALRRRLQ